MKLRALLILLASAAANAERPVLAVVEKIAGEVGFYNAEGKRIAGVQVGEHPHEAVVSADGRTLYVSDNGILWMQYAGAGGNTISIIDIATMTKSGVIDLGEYRRPHGLAIDPRTGLLLSTIENPDGLLLIDPIQRRVLRKFDIKGEDPHMVLLSADSKHAYVSNTTTNAIAALEVGTGAVKLIPTGARPQGGVLSADGSTVYMTNSDANAIAIIDATTNEAAGSIAVGKGPGRVALTPDGSTLVYCLGVDQAVGFASVGLRKQVAQIPLGGQPLSLTLSPDGKLAYAGIQDQDKIHVISVAERRIISTIQTPPKSGPDPAIPLPIPGWSQGPAREWRDTFASHWLDTRHYTLAMFDAMPPAGLASKPDPAQRTFADQFIHIGRANVAYMTSFDTGITPPAPPAETAPKPEIRAYLDATFDYVDAVLETITEEQLSRTNYKFSPRVRPHSGTELFLRAYMHTSHHRGQAVTYLRVRGITPPSWIFEPSGK